MLKIYEKNFMTCEEIYKLRKPIAEAEETRTSQQIQRAAGEKKKIWEEIQKSSETNRGDA